MLLSDRVCGRYNSTDYLTDGGKMSDMWLLTVG